MKKQKEAGLYVLKTETDNPRNKPLDPEARARIMRAFENWGFIKHGEISTENKNECG